MSKHINVGVWNCKVGRNPARVVATIVEQVEAHRLRAVALQEVSPAYAAALRRLRGWTLVGDHIATSGAAILVRGGRRRGWTFRSSPSYPRLRRKAQRLHGNQPGRHTPTVKVGWLRLASVHLPAQRKRNRVAYGAMLDRLGVFVQNQRRRSPVAMLGDWNAGASTPGTGKHDTPRALAERLHLTVVAPAGGGIDYGLLAGCTGTLRSVGRHGSDHAFLVGTVTKG